MKTFLIPFLMAVAPLSFAAQHQPTHTTSIKTTASIVYDATEDFTVLDAGTAPYYKDKRNDALGIDARVYAFRDEFARANREFDGKSGAYDITITPLTEEDGEPLYRLLVNGKIVGSYRSSYIGKGSPKDLKTERHTWRDITLQKGDTLSIESAADTNGEIPEHGGTAWARGRWQDITLNPAKKGALPRPHFRPRNDLLLAQFDLKPDADDLHAVAALGSLLKHPDAKNVTTLAVSGTVGIQDGTYLPARDLFKLAFGRENLNWVDASKNWNNAVQQVRYQVRAVLAKGGQVFVAEAGQSDFTRDWVEGLLKAGVAPSVIKNNVIVVQHSAWNEKHTTSEDLAFVKQYTRYQTVNDGNEPMREFDRSKRRGPLTPEYVSDNQRWIKTAISKKNGKAHARQLWTEAHRLFKKSGFDKDHSTMPKGGVDFSDVVEAWWILDLSYRAPSVHGFWDRYVTDITLDKINPPKGRLAVVIDGNSPDPDDIGATPVMFGLLKQTGLSHRLVHLSHSCDLDPFRNKGKQQINAKNEARRQKVLHALSGKGTQLFGPFKNLRDYYNCRVDQEGAKNDLVDAINASSKSDPLWIVEAGEPDLIGYALQDSDATKHTFVHVISHHPANDNSGDYFTWQQILDFGVTEHQIGDQNVGLQTPVYPWDWAKDHKDKGIAFIWEKLAYAEQDGVVKFQSNKFDCSDAGMVYWWITGAHKGGNNTATVFDIKDMLLDK